MGAIIAIVCGMFSVSCSTASASVRMPAHAYWLNEVNEASAKATIEYLDAAVTRGDHGVTIYIHSPGGSVWDGFELAQHIEQSPIPVTCIVDGYAASMASYILESCQVRVMTRRSSIMFHQPTISGVSGNEEKMRNIAERLRIITKLLTEHAANRMHISSAELLARIQGGREMWLDYEEALKLGAVDRAI